MKSNQCSDGKYYIICDLCINCGVCESACPVNAIHSSGFCYKIDSSKCVCCDACAEACPAAAIMISMF